LRLFFLLVWLYAVILFELLNLESLLHEVEHNFFCGLAVVQSDLDTPSPVADATEVVDIDGYTDYVLAPTDPLKVFSLIIFWQVSNNQVDHLRFRILFVVFK